MRNDTVRRRVLPVAIEDTGPALPALAPEHAAAVREGRDPEVNGEEGARNVALLEEAIA